MLHSTVSILVYLSLSCFLLVNMATDEVDHLYRLYYKLKELILLITSRAAIGSLVPGPKIAPTPAL